MLTGKWKLNHNLSSDQKPLMKGLGRKRWEIWVVNDADEIFRLLHFKRDHNGKETHFFDKNVDIFLKKGVVYKNMARVMRLVGVHIEADKVHYEHKLVANRAPKACPNDEKRFGDCVAITDYDAPTGVMTIFWQLKNARLLTVTHRINAKDQLQVDMKLKQHQHTWTAQKIYDRVEFSKEDKQYMREHNHAQYLLKPEKARA